MNSLVLFCVSVISIAFLSALIRKFVEGVFPQKIFAMIVFPGIVLHEIFHAVASVLVGGKIHGIKLFSLSGGSVLHEKPKVPFGQLFISFAPFIGGLAVMIFLGFTVFGPLGFKGMPNSIDHFWNIRAHISLPWFLISFYVLYSVSATMLPSGQDVKNTIIGLITLLLGSGILFWASSISLPVEFLEKANEMLTGYVLPILLVFTIVSFVCFLLRKAMR